MVNCRFFFRMFSEVGRVSQFSEWQVIEHRGAQLFLRLAIFVSLVVCDIPVVMDKFVTPCIYKHGYLERYTKVYPLKVYQMFFFEYIN